MRFLKTNDVAIPGQPCKVNMLGLGAPQGVGEHRVANVEVEDQDERFQGDHRLHLLATVSAQAEQVLLVGSVATRGTWVPRTSKSWG